MTIRCALSQLSLPAHHSAHSAGESPAGGAFPASELLKLSGVMSPLLHEAQTAAIRGYLPPRLRGERSGGSLDRGAQCEQRLFGEGLADELQPQRQSLNVENRRHRNGRKPGHVDGHRENVIEIHLDRAGAPPFTKTKCRRRRRRRQNRIDSIGKTFFEVALDERAYFLRAQV